MKRMKLVLSAFAIVAVVGSALAFKTSAYFGQGGVFCTSATTNQCVSANLVDFAFVGTNPGTPTPCPAGETPYRLVPGTPNPICQQITSGNFVSTSTNK